MLSSSEGHTVYPGHRIDCAPYHRLCLPAGMIDPFVFPVAHGSGLFGDMFLASNYLGHERRLW